MLHKKEEKSPYRLDPPKKMHRAKQAVLSQNQTSQVKTLSFSYHWTANLMQRNLSISGGAASQRPAAPRRSGEEPRAGSRRRCVDLGRSDGGAWNEVGGAAAGRRRNGGQWASLELGFHVYLWRSGNWAGPWKFSYPRRVDWKKAHEFCRLTMRRTKRLIPTDFQTMKINMYTDW